MGVFDKVNAALTGKADQGGLRDGHTTSGMDAALQAHVNKIHPVSDTKVTKSADPVPKYKPATAPAGGYALKLPGDDQ